MGGCVEVAAVVALIGIPGAGLSYLFRMYVKTRDDRDASYEETIRDQRKQLNEWHGIGEEVKQKRDTLRSKARRVAEA